MKDNVKAQLLSFFRTSIAVFEFMQKMADIYSPDSTYNIGCNKMYSLHRIALTELEKDNPDAVLVDNLLEEMQIFAEQHAKK